jgi:hypothetical protein
MEWKGSLRISHTVILSVLLSILSLSLAPPSSGDPEVDYDVVKDLGIAVDSEDNLHIVWEDGRDDEVYIYQHPTWGSNVAVETKIYYAKFDSNGQRLMDDKSISSGGGEAPSIEIDSNDNVWVTYWMNGSYALKLTKEGDVMWEKVLHHRTLGGTAIAIGSDDSVYLSWDECERQRCYRHFMALDTDGNALTGVTNVSLVTPISGFHITLDGNGKYVYLGSEGASDSNNNIHLITGSASYDLFYTKISNIGEIEVNRTQINLSGKWDASPRVSIDASDNVHVVAETWGNIGHFELDNSGNVLRTKTDIRAGEAGDEQMKPDLDLDSLGRVYIVWHVEKEIEGEPHTGLTDTSYSSYCTRIDADGSAADDPWLVASSKTGQEFDPLWPITIVYIATVLIIVAVTALTVLIAKKRWKRREQASVHYDEEAENHPITERRIKK